VNTVAVEPLPPQVLHGKRIFYHAGDRRMSAEGYLSCATCHIDGDDDGRTWDFTGRGEGLRNTTVLNGRGGMAHGRVHWSANFDEIQDFENDIRLFFGGTGFMSNADFNATSNPLGPPKAGRSSDLDALAAYVASLGDDSIPRSPFRTATGGYTDAARQGEAIFGREGCAECHTPPRYTNSTLPTSTLTNVGTLRASSGNRLGQPLLGIDTPTLRGVWASAPYFHDGSAPTLEDVFRVTGGITLPAESGQVSGGATLVTNFVDINNDDVVRGRAYVSLSGPSQRLTFNNVNGGPGGIGAIEVRGSNSRTGTQTQLVSLRVNGVTLPNATLVAANNDPTWRATNFSTVWIENVPLNPGPTNTIELSTNEWYLAVDEIVVANAGHLAQAQAHRRVAGLPQAERDALLAFLRELDGSPPPSALESLFSNGFEP
jgi:hypothetical protein